MPTAMEEPIMIPYSCSPRVPLHPDFQAVLRDASIDESIRVEAQAVRDEWYVFIFVFAMANSIAIHSCIAIREARLRSCMVTGIFSSPTDYIAPTHEIQFAELESSEVRSPSRLTRHLNIC